MKTIFAFFLYAFSFTVLAQESHQKQALELEELLEKNNPEQFRSIRRKANYLVLNNYRKGNAICVDGEIFFTFGVKPG